jgi:hypothetical protein
MVNQMSDLKATGMTLESIAGMPSSRPVNKESAQQERLNEIVRNSLSPVAGGLGIIYTVLAISHIVGLHTTRSTKYINFLLLHTERSFP